MKFVWKQQIFPKGTWHDFVEMLTRGRVMEEKQWEEKFGQIISDVKSKYSKTYLIIEGTASDGF